MNNQQGYGPAVTLADAAKEDASKITKKKSKKTLEYEFKGNDLEIGQGQNQEVTGS
tara:strand:- start:508 stop:675 length:168 start_codon:yes stop_codon:yes gene_type:complete